MQRTGDVVTGLGIILAFQALGALLQYGLGLQIPAPVIGFFLLWGALSFGWLPLGLVEAAADFLLAHLLLLFTPVVVGVLPYLPLLQRNGPVLAAAVVAGTVATLAVTGWMAQLLLIKHATKPPATSTDAVDL